MPRAGNIDKSSVTTQQASQLAVLLHVRHTHSSVPLCQHRALVAKQPIYHQSAVATSDFKRDIAGLHSHMYVPHCTPARFYVILSVILM